MKKKLYLFLIMGSLLLTFAHALPSPFNDPRVQKVYEIAPDQMIWIKEGSWTACGKTLLDTLSRVEEEGLWADDYLPLVNHIRKADLSSAEAGREADALLTLAALNYISDMEGERLNPRLADKNIFIQAPSFDEVEFLTTHLSSSDACGWIPKLIPATPDYLALKQLLAHYRQKKAQGGWPQLPKGTKLKKGDQGPLIEILRAQLIAQDSLALGSQANGVFDEVLEEALKKYQAHHGLEQDGKVGGETLEALNTPVEARIKSILLSLERLRWLPDPLSSRYILVNIPGFYLRAVDEKGSSFFMPIITGQEHRKTPAFFSTMTEVIFNPSWHVPVSIAVKDKLPKLKKNPHTFTAKGYHYYDASGRELNPASVDWHAYSGGNFPVKIVQSPGNANALGKIRFTIDSPFSVYLHGTPDQKLFGKAKRSLSSGCIRVADPVKLASFVLDDPQKWSLERIREESLGTRTKKVKLEKPLPVFITYFTVFRDEYGSWHFVDDGYDQDRNVGSALEKAKRKN